MGSSSPTSPQRGATLVTYALIVTSVTLAALSSLNALVDNSEEFLVESGDAVATPRPYDHLAIDDQTLAAPVGWQRVEPGSVTTAPPDPSSTNTAPSTTSTTAAPSSSTTAPSTSSTTAAPSSSTAPPAEIFTESALGTHAGKCLGVDRDGWLRQQDCIDQANQKFTAPLQPDGTVQLVSPDGSCIGVAEGDFGNGARVQSVDCSSPSASWATNGVSPLTLVNAAVSSDQGRDMCLDIEGGSYESGASLVLWPCHGGLVE